MNVVQDSLPPELPTDQEYASELLAALAQFRREYSLCDVELQVENEENEGRTGAGLTRGVWAHRAVLAAASPYFRTLFTSQVSERSTQSVVIKGVEPEALRALVDYVYSPASLQVTAENAEPLLVAAMTLNVGRMRNAVCAAVIRGLGPENALRIRASAELHGCVELAAAATRYINNHFELVLQANEILTLTTDALVTLLDCERPVASEEHVLDAVLRWTRHCPQERHQHLSSLLRVVRLSLLPQEFLSQRARIEPLASADPLVLRQIIDALIATRSNNVESFVMHQIIEALTSDQDLLQTSNNAQLETATNPRNPLSQTSTNTQQQITSDQQFQSSTHAQRRQLGTSTEARQITTESQPQTVTNATLLLMGGFEINKNKMLIHPLPNRRWYSSQSPKLSHVGAAVLNDRVYIVGGFVDRRAVSVYDPAMDLWSRGPKLSIGRRLPNVVALGGLLYAVGGTARHQAGAVEAMDPREGIWLTVTGMRTRRKEFGVTVLGGSLYAVGGIDFDECPLNLVERYDPTAGRWEAVEAMTERRSGVAVSVVDGALYAVGGWAERSNVHRSMERYLPGSGWETAPAMSTPRSYSAVTAHDSRLYVVGGHDGQQTLSSAAIFDGVTRTWNELPSLPGPRMSATAVVVDWPRPLQNLSINNNL